MAITHTWVNSNNVHFIYLFIYLFIYRLIQ